VTTLRQLIFLILLGPLAHGLTLREALEQGLGAHALLESAEARVRGAEGLAAQSALKPNPRLFLQSENARAWGRPGFQYGQDADSFLYASQVIETGGKRAARVAAAQAGVQRTAAERDALRWQLAGRIGMAYWSAAGAARYREAFAESLRNFELTVQYHRDRVKEGAMAEVDLLRVQLESERLRAAYRTAEQDAVAARIRLFREMGLADQPGVGFTEPMEVLPEVERPGDGVGQRPDLLPLRQAIRQANANVRLQQSNARPDPEVLAGYKRTSGYNTVVTGVQINLPFRNRNEGNIAAAAADVTVATAAERAAERVARAEAEAAYTNYEARRGLVTGALPALRERAREIARISNAAYREGGADLLRLLDAERGRIEADLLYFRALTEFHLAVVELQTALGILR
jgi:cobalt-zinc-cadmium efflux system outer membrane protein